MLPNYRDDEHHWQSLWFFLWCSLAHLDPAVCRWVRIAVERCAACKVASRAFRSMIALWLCTKPARPCPWPLQTESPHPSRNLPSLRQNGHGSVAQDSLGPDFRAAFRAPAIGQQANGILASEATRGGLNKVCPAAMCPRKAPVAEFAAPSCPMMKFTIPSETAQLRRPPCTSRLSPSRFEVAQRNGSRRSSELPLCVERSWLTGASTS